MWQIANKRPEKLRDNLHDLEVSQLSTVYIVTFFYNVVLQS